MLLISIGDLATSVSAGAHITGDRSFCRVTSAPWTVAVPCNDYTAKPLSSSFSTPDNSQASNSWTDVYRNQVQQWLRSTTSGLVFDGLSVAHEKTATYAAVRAIFNDVEYLQAKGIHRIVTIWQPLHRGIYLV